MPTIHAYKYLSLFGTGVIVSIVLILVHVLMLVKADAIKTWLQLLPRNEKLGQWLMILAMIWFWLFIAPPGLGILSSLSMDVQDFNNFKPILRIAIPIIAVLLIMSIDDFLSLRALGTLGFLVAYLLLESAFLKEPLSRLLIVCYAYGIIAFSFFAVGKPHLIRNLITWATKQPARWNMLSISGLAFSIIMLMTALIFWRGY